MTDRILNIGSLIIGSFGIGAFIQHQTGQKTVVAAMTIIAAITLITNHLAEKVMED